MIPYTVEPRPDTGVTNVTMGVWLLVASEVMLFGALFSSYALLRASAVTWPDGADLLIRPAAAAVSCLLAGIVTLAWRAARVATSSTGRWLVACAAGAAGVLVVQAAECWALIAQGRLPATSTFLALYFTLTGVHAIHIAGGGIACVWAAAGRARAPELIPGRARALFIYWIFVALMWAIIVSLFHLT
jgi:heme/copper-type cytochrome/quinol oxidase subunit 3